MKTLVLSLFFFFQAEDGIRDFHVTGVQTCALPILNILGNAQEGNFHLLRQAMLHDSDRLISDCTKMGADDQSERVQAIAEDYCVQLSSMLCLHPPRSPCIRNVRRVEPLVHDSFPIVVLRPLVQRLALTLDERSVNDGLAGFEHFLQPLLASMKRLMS